MNAVTPFAIRVSFDNNLDTILTDGEQYDVPIGALASFLIVVTVDGVEVPVIQSTWEIMGEQIVGAVQTPEEGTANIVPDTVMSGNPSSVSTAWVQEGSFNISITGTFLWLGAPFNFSAAGSVTVHAPTFVITGNTPSVLEPSLSSDAALTTQFTVPSLQYYCDPVTIGGNIGFLQIINGLRLRGEQPEQPSQSAGSLQSFVDISQNSLFYYSEIAQTDNTIATTDLPTLPCTNAFSWYKIGDVGTTENYSMYLAYQAPVTPGIIESYIVVYAVCNWGWSVEAVFENNTWTIETGTPDDYCNGWATPQWSTPTWTDNSADLLDDWQSYSSP